MKADLRTRNLLSSIYIRGTGIEIGALHCPQWIQDGVKVYYVDRLAENDLRFHYPELANESIVKVDIVDDGEYLSKIKDGTLNFIIANHMLEHSQNPIGTIRNHIKKLTKDGTLFLSVPDKRYTFDKNRLLTTFEHLVKDDTEGADNSKVNHYNDWVKYVEVVHENID